jgi:hypothetical protein
MYASPASLLRLPPPRRRVNRGKFALAELGRLPERLLQSVDSRQSCACGAWTPGGANLADFGRSKRVGEQPSLSGEQCLSRCACGAGDAGENRFLKKNFEFKKS